MTLSGSEKVEKDWSRQPTTDEIREVKKVFAEPVSHYRSMIRVSVAVLSRGASHLHPEKAAAANSSGSGLPFDLLATSPGSKMSPVPY